MSRIKRQHIVPRLYLKYFTPDGKRTYVYIKKLNKYKFVSIKDICVKEDFYTIKHKGVCHNFIETYLSDHIEPLLGKCIESIINYVNTQSCQLDLPNICRSLICQYYRGTDFRIEANNIARIRISIFQSLFSTPLNPDIIEKTDATLEHASDTFCNTPFIKDRINLILKYSDWSIMVSDQHQFITSDRPVISFCIVEKNQKKIYVKTDIGSPSSYILMTITPNILLHIRLHSSVQRPHDNMGYVPIVNAGPDYVKSVNYIQMLNYDEQLYSKAPFNLHDIYIAESES